MSRLARGAASLFREPRNQPLAEPELVRPSVISGMFERYCGSLRNPRRSERAARFQLPEAS